MSNKEETVVCNEVPCKEETPKYEPTVKELRNTPKNPDMTKPVSEGAISDNEAKALREVFSMAIQGAAANRTLVMSLMQFEESLLSKLTNSTKSK